MRGGGRGKVWHHVAEPFIRAFSHSVVNSLGRPVGGGREQPDRRPDPGAGGGRAAARTPSTEAADSQNTAGPDVEQESKPVYCCQETDGLPKPGKVMVADGRKSVGARIFVEILNSSPVWHA